MSGTCYELFAANHDRHGGIVSYGRKISYKSFLRDVDKLAASFGTFGLRRGDVVTLYLPTCVQAIALFYACSKAGIVANIVHPLTPVARLKESMATVGSKMLFFYDVLVKDQNELVDCGAVVRCSVADYSKHKLAFSAYAHFVSKHAKCTKYTDLLKCEPSNAVEGCAEDVVCIMHSGGTGGEPRLIRLQNSALNGLAQSMYEMYTTQQRGHAPRHGEYSLVALPIFHAYGLGVAIHSEACFGFSLLLAPKFSAKRINGYIKRYNVTLFATVPVMLRKLLALGNFKGRHLRKLKDIWCGGDVVDENLIEHMNAVLSESGSKTRVMRGYGLTETCSVCACNTNANCRKFSSGKPIPGCQLEIRGEDGAKLPPNVVGEVAVSAPSVMLGYYGEAPLRETDGKRWLLTGDLGYLDEDGYLFLVDRKKRVVKISAVNVFPSEIESTVKQLDFVDEACAVPYHLNNKPFIKVFVTLSRPVDEETAKREVVEACRKNLIKYSVPKTVVILPSMPRTKFGKVDYKLLETM